MHPAGRQAAAARILVVDDDASIRLLCRVNLELDGYEVIEAESLAEARTRLDDGPADLVLLDLHLGSERSGELVAECHARRPRVPVVLITGSARLGDEAPSDVDAVLPKPFELDDLLSTVRDLCRLHAGL